MMPKNGSPVVTLCPKCHSLHPCWQHTELTLQGLDGAARTFPGLLDLVIQLTTAVGHLQARVVELEQGRSAVPALETE